MQLAGAGRSPQAAAIQQAAQPTRWANRSAGAATLTTTRPTPPPPTSSASLARHTSGTA